MRPEVLEGDVREVLKTLDDESVQCVVTSPPYWGLRDYGTATCEGGDENCSHQRDSKKSDKTITGHKGMNEQGHVVGDAIYKSACPKCGAVRKDKQLGLEETPEDYVKGMVDVFREVKRVLRKDGTVWLNLGDSYWSDTLSRKDPVESMWGKRPASNLVEGRHKLPQNNKRGGLGKRPPNLKPKDLVGIPWRVAFALQEDGWYLRSDIIWNKPNPMPEPVKDRPTKAHEYIFLLTKSAKYYYDYEAIKEKGEYPAGTRAAKASDARSSMSFVNSRPPEYKIYDGTRNKRSVWEITTKPYKDAHFATFPEEIPETCIKAGTSKAGCCADCGSPYERIMEKPDMTQRPIRSDDSKYEGRSAGRDYKVWRENNPNVFVGWEPTCNCNAEKVPCVVLDIFAGSGTTLRVASKLGRKGIGIELNPEYIKILKKRCKIESMSLNDF